VNPLHRIGENVVRSRLLVLQSKRLLLTNANTRLLVSAKDQAEIDVEKLSSAVREAHRRYNETVLKWGSPDTPQYRLIAYGSMIAKAENLQSRLRHARGLGFEDRGLQDELVALETMIDGWRSTVREAMSASVA
jgi:hypothetical protein